MGTISDTQRRAIIAKANRLNKFDDSILLHTIQGTEYLHGLMKEGIIDFETYEELKQITESEIR